MKRIVALMTVGTLMLLGDASWARREALTSEQKSQMERIDRVLIDVLALSDQGPLDARPLVEVVANRMKEFGYTPVTDLLTRVANPVIVQITAAFSVMTHFEAFQRGVLDTRDVVFFISVIGFALFATGVIIRNQRAG